MTTAAADLLARTPNVLLDFDGPICAVFGGIDSAVVARRLRDRLGLTEEHSTEGRDPFEILRFAAAEGHREARVAERELARLEVEAVATAPPTPGAAELLKALHEREQAVMVVSNNSAAAVRTYVDVHGLAVLVRGVSARTDHDPTLLKPSPYLLQRAIEQLDATPDNCVIIGDSVTDIEAGRAAGTAVIAYANKAGKLERFAVHRPDAIACDMADLTEVHAS